MNAEDFAAWAGPHVTAMARLAARLAPGADRDDIVQESLVRAWIKRRQYDAARGAPSAWLLAITADQARKAAAKVRRLAPAVDDVAVTGRGPDDDLDLRTALDQLTERQRLAVDCVYFAGLTVAETAAVMRCAEGTVKSTLADARTKLRTYLEVVG
ncbi:RNA polymerase sigma factor [Lentzea rhizosphaerae]|jgi:DNA-directed RNA polymerase specialized sigma24 family protein|uniref:RNA polymerase sigma factor n=1 Tax=Lentzea rhizosphaerae TaxID=2041025 RepID=A0ABV8BYZ3_9PSEU